MSDKLLDDSQLKKMLFDFAKHVALSQVIANEKINGFFQIDSKANIDIEGQLDGMVHFIQQQKKLYADKIISNDVEHTKWFVDITGEYDYYHMVKRPMVEKHKNQLRAEQRKLNNQLSGGDE